MESNRSTAAEAGSFSAKVYPLRRPSNRANTDRPAKWSFTLPGGPRGLRRGKDSRRSGALAAQAPETHAGADPLPLLDAASPKAFLADVRVIGQLHGTFVLLEHPAGLLVMDQHTAHERVLYARLCEKADTGKVERQALLIPETLEMSAKDALLLGERLDDLDRLGLGIEPFGPSSFIVREVPALLAHVNPASLVQDVIEGMAEPGARKKNFSDLADRVIDKMACRGAVKAHHSLGREEIEHLVQECLELDLLFTCPHGRPITLVLPKEEVERRFLRR